MMTGESTLAATVQWPWPCIHEAPGRSWMSTLYLPDMPQPLDLHWIMTRVGRCRQRSCETADDIVRHGGSVVLDVGMHTFNDRMALRSLIEKDQLQASCNGSRMRTCQVAGTPGFYQSRP